MKKTLTVNLGGTVFHIDEDAYRLLDEYLSNLKLHFRKEEGAEEIVNDMESRISELFAEKISSVNQVITIAHVEEIIERMGKPEDLSAGQDTNSSFDQKNNTEGASAPKEGESVKRRLYRNPDDKMLGGVAGGLAAYLGCDATVLRLLFLLLLFFGVGTLIPVYIVCWLVIPEARTAAEKLSMRGEEINVHNIGKTVTDSFERAASGLNDYVHSEKPRTLLQRLADAFVALMGFFLKACLVIFAIIFSPVLFVLALVFVVLIIAAFSILIGGGAALFHMIPYVDWGFVSASPMVTIVASIAGAALVGIPLFAVVFTILKYMLKWRPMNSGLKWTLAIFWAISAIVFLLSLAHLNWEIPFVTTYFL